VSRLASTAALTLLALVAFAGNSILTRLALGAHLLDAGTFTAVRLGAGVVVLLLLLLPRLRASGVGLLRGSPAPALALFAYAAPFSFAYLRIGAAVGALVLFGTVQLTMISWGIAHGERPRPRTWCGLVLAAGGLLLLTLPRVMRPDPLGVVLMVVAGMAWGAYSLLGKGAAEPLVANARAFVGALVPALALPPLLALAARGGHGPGLTISARGLGLAVVSGGVTSALGYAIWYRALRGLAATQAAIVQLSVPVLAAFAAWLLLGEHLSLHLFIAGAAVLGGVALVLTTRTR
jgi:drug/metabolite transporter (DMT)-like permease